MRVAIFLCLVAFHHADSFTVLRDMVKQTINTGSATISMGLAAKNSALQATTAIVSNGIQKGTQAGKLAMGTGTALAGHALAVGANAAISSTGKMDNIMQGLPIVGPIVKVGNDKLRQTISAVNRIGQTTINGLDDVIEASTSLSNKANEFGTKLVSKAVKIDTALGHTTNALANSIMQSSVDNYYNFGHNVANQIMSGKFNISALSDNMLIGSKFILNENSKAALANLLPALNETFSHHHSS